MAKNNVVIDVNVFLASFFFRSKLCDEILENAKEKVVILLSCQELIAELQNKVYQFKDKVSSQELAEIQTWFTFLENTAHFIQLKSNFKICRDPKDDYLVNLAIDGLAMFLITRDKDLLEIEMEKLKQVVITPENFVEILRKPKIKQKQ